MATRAPDAAASPSLRRLRRPALCYLLLVELAALALLGWGLRHGVGPLPVLGRALLLLGLAALYGEASDRIDRLHRYLGTDGAVSNQNSVLCFAGLLVLPAGLAAALVVAVYLHGYLRARRWRTALAYRAIFSAASTVLATFAASALLHRLGVGLQHVGARDAVLVLLAMAVYTTVNLVLLVVCLRLVDRDSSWAAVLPGRRHVNHENTTLLFGAFSGVLVLHAPWLSPLILVLLASLHRASLVTDLQQRARTDAKTGLLNAGGWQLLASQHLAHCVEREVPAAIVLVDLDHFKRINDTHGHLTGDVVLKQVADILVRELRGYDAVGRYGGEEFIALLPGVSDQAAVAIGERIRQRIGSNLHAESVPVTVSVGVAIGQARQDPSLEDIIDAADTALYRAKTAGRNRVCLAAPAQLTVWAPGAGQVPRRLPTAPREREPR